MVDVPRNARIIKYVDDTVLYVAGNSTEIMESQLLDDLNLLAEWFNENELILYPKNENANRFES